MFRKIRPLEKKISTVFSLRHRRSQNSAKSTQSPYSPQAPSSPQEEIQQMIPPHSPQEEVEQMISPRTVQEDSQQMISDEVQTHSHTEPSYDPVDTEETSQDHSSVQGRNETLGSTANQSFPDSLETRYHRAMKTESSINVVHNLDGAEEAARKPLNADSENSSDLAFDWNETDESELDEDERQKRQERILREVQGHEQNEHLIRHAKRLRKVYLFLMRISRPVRTIIIALLGSGIAITPAAVVVSRYPDSPVKNQILVWSIWLSISFSASCASSIFVDILPSTMIKLFNLFYGSTPEKLKTQVELWMNVRFWTRVALGLTWCWVILVIICSPVFPFHKDPNLQYFDWVMKVFAGFFTAGVVLLGEKILLQVIQLNFHKISLKDRLEENERALWALDRLAAAKDISHSPKKRNSKFRNSFNPTRPKSEGKMLRFRDSTVVDVPATPTTPNARELQRTIELKPAFSNKELASTSVQKKRRSSHLSMFTDQLAIAISNAAMKGGRRSVSDAVVSRHSAKKLAKKLFEGLDEDRGGVISRNEFEPYFKTASDAAMAFKLFDKDGNGDIDRKEMRNAVSRIYRERSALATGLKDMSSAVAKLDAVLFSIAFVLTIFIWLFIFNPKETSSQLVPMATIVLGFSFVFGNAAKNLFESMLFIFSVHPYDVGDMVLIDEHYMYVLEFGLFSTTFQRVDGQVLVAPNSILTSKKHILNIRRSGGMWETTELMVGFETPLEVLHEFRARLRQYVADNSREWKGGLDVNIDFIQNQNLIQLIVAMEHKTNWQDWGARWERRTSLMKEMKRIMDNLNIVYKLPIQPVSFLPQTPRHRGAPATPIGNNSRVSSVSRHGRLLNLPPLRF